MDKEEKDILDILTLIGVVEGVREKEKQPTSRELDGYQVQLYENIKKQEKEMNKKDNEKGEI